mgnify:CR=1 FL=1
MQLINLDNVKEFMDERDMSEQEFAKIMGITRSYLFRVLRGDRQPGRKFIEGLFRAGMVVDDIFLTSPLPKGNTSNDDSKTASA